MLKLCPDPVDVTDLQFKLQCRLKVFHNEHISQFPNACSLLSCASRYGLVFIGSNSNHFQVIQSNTFQRYSLLAVGKSTYAADYPRQSIELPSAAKHLSVNCDSTVLAVVVEKDQCPTVIFYEVLSFLRQDTRVIKELRLSMTPNVFAREVNWNPSIPGIFTACKSDGSLGVYELNGESVDINELPVAANATCFCWSPKGKQIAVGSPDGKITQYKPDLKAVKVVNGPKLAGLSTMLSLQWVSNYQFVAVYQVGETEASIVVVDAPKTGEPSFTDYSDICYSQEQRPAQFYLLLQQTWNILMVASANSTEVGVLGKEGECWTQWNMLDTARAELPLGAQKENSLPVGFALDISATEPVRMGESTIPPCPYLCILSHQGVLCCFNVINTKAGVPQVCTPPDPVSDTSGLHKFTSVSAPENLKPPSAVKFGIDSIIAQPPNSGPANPSAPLSALPGFAGVSKVPVQSTPIATGKGAVDLSAAGLFGGQTSVTPIKPQQPPKTMTLFGGQTVVAPISKTSNSAISTTTSGPASNFNEKYSSIFASVNPTTPPPVNALPVKPIVISVAPPKPMPSQPPETAVTLPNQDSVNPSHILSEMTREEWNILETELRIVSEINKAVKVSVGTDSEMVAMIEQIKSLEEFVQDIVAVNVGQSSEIHCLKQNMIQSWAWFEEAKSYYHSSKNEAIALLIKVQPLDSLSQKRLRVIEQLVYYIESQLSQVNKTLDEQWDNFQDYAKKTYKVKMPTMETIFQTMVRQNAVLQKQAFVLKDIQMRLRKKASITNSLLLNLSGDLSLADDLAALQLDPQSLLKQQYEKIKKHSQHMSGGKAGKLRNLLIQREVTRVQARKPQVPSWAINQSPASKLRLSMAKLRGSQSLAARSLDLTQAAQIEPSKTNDNVSLVAKKEESLPPTSSFSLLKTGPAISSSEGSAFTRIGSSLSFSGAPSGDAQQVFNSTASKNGSTATAAISPAISSNSSLTPAPQSSTNSTLPAFFTTPASSSSAFGPKGPFAASASIPTSASVAATKSTGQAPAASAPTTTNAEMFGKTSFSSFFGGTASSSSLFAPSEGGLLFGNSTAAPLFGASPVPTTRSATSSATSPSIFGRPPATTAPTSSEPSFAALTSSIFGSAPATAAPVSSTTSSIFGCPPATTAPTSSEPSFAALTSSIFGGAPAPAAPVSSTTSSIFGSPPATASSAPSFAALTSNIFGSAPATDAPVSSTTSSIFGSPDTTASPFAVSTATTKSGVSLFGKQSRPIFGFSAPPVSASSAPALSKEPGPVLIPSASDESSVVSSGGSNSGKDAVQSSVPLFYTPAPSSTPTTTAPIFGKVTTSATSSAPVVSSAFGGGSLFASPSATSCGLTSNPSSAGSIYGGPPAAASTTGAFGSSTTTVPIFGRPDTVTSFGSGATSSGSIFGTPSSSATVFGSSAPTTTASVFGRGTSSPGSIFGSGVPSTVSSVFGASTSVASSGSIFGQPIASGAPIFGAASSNSPAFGSTSSSTTTGSIFGATSPPQPATMFGASSNTSRFGQPAAFGSQAFGVQNANSSSAFGQLPAYGSNGGSTVFGTTTTTSGTIFGTPAVTSSTSFGTTTASAFGSSTTPKASSGPFGFGGLSVGSPAAGSSNIFGASSGTGFAPSLPASKSIFGSPTSTASSIFGASSGTAFGSNSSGGNFGTSNVFGGTSFGAKPAFGQTSAFGTGTFGSPQGGAFSGATGTPVAQSGFGSAASFQKPSGFGSAPVFGGSSAPAFGSPPTFGSSPSFGAAPSFGTPEKVFGAGQPATGGFAAATPENTGFGNLASQNTIGFGNLAQQASTPPSASFSGFSSFSSWR